MGYSVYPAPAAGSKTRYCLTLTSGTSWTVPAGVTYVNVTLYGAGGGGQPANPANYGTAASAGGNTTFTGATSANGGPGANLANTNQSFTGSTGALAQGGMGGTAPYSNAGILIGKNGGSGDVVTSIVSTTPGASISYAIGAGGSGGAAPSGGNGGAGGNGKIDIEYWL